MYPGVLAPILFGTLIPDVDDGTEQALSRFADAWDKWLTRRNVVLLSRGDLEPGENGWQETHEAQQAKEQRPVPGKVQPLVPE